MKKYHLTKNFDLAVCGATKRACPRGEHLSAESFAKVKAGLAETREEKIFQNLYPIKKRVHVADAVPVSESDKTWKLLSNPQLHALEDYAGMDYFELNQYLNEGGSGNVRMDKQIAQIDSAFEVVKPENRYVSYRGEKINVRDGETFEKAVFREFFPDSVIERKSYFSTSRDPSIASYFAGKDAQSVVLEVRAKSGISTKKVSDSTKEEEMLLPRGSKFKVLMVKPYVQYEKIDYCEESNNLSVSGGSKQIMTIVLEEI